MNPGLDKRRILGIPTEVMSCDAAVALLDQKLTARQPTAVAFLNAHAATLAQQDPAFAAALQNFTIFNDGIGIDIASLLTHGKMYPANLNGTDFIPRYLAETRHNLRLFLLGGEAAIVEKTAQKFRQDFPRHRVVGTMDGYSYREKNVAAMVRASGADVMLVALGNPLQEMWIHENLAATGAVLAFGVGSLFNFIAGAQPRAPRFMRLLRSEWLFRLWCEPKRLWRRYLIGNLMFLAYVLRDLGRRD